MENTMKLKLEGYPDRDNATVANVAWAVREIASANGPTFLVVELSDEVYAQAAGTRGRYVIESRTKFGEGFQHLRVCHPLAGRDGKSVVHYRQRCERHRPRRCPLNVKKSEVSTFAEVEQALVHFARTGKRDGRLQWRDVTAQYIKDRNRPAEDDDEITQIVPGG